MISYEISMGLSIIPVLMIYSTLDLSNIVEYQAANGWLLLPVWSEGLSWAALDTAGARSYQLHHLPHLHFCGSQPHAL